MAKVDIEFSDDITGGELYEPFQLHSQLFRTALIVLLSC